MYKTLIFDLDGTLLNTLGDLAGAGNFALGELGFPTFSEEDYKLFVGNGIPKLVERILPESAREACFDKALRLFGEFYSEHCAEKTVPYDGIPELLQDLRSRGIVCLCNTNKAHKYAKALVERFFGSLITETAGADIGFPKKPAPDAALYLAQKYSADLQSVLYIGDSAVDMQTAENAGLDACGVLWGFRSREELESRSPRFIATTVGSLGKIIFS